MTIVWVILAVVIALILLWLWAIAPHLPRADFSAFAKYDYAHRGLHDKEKGVPENSLLAFDMACRGGFGMELDLQPDPGRPDRHPPRPEHPPHLRGGPEHR